MRVVYASRDALPAGWPAKKHPILTHNFKCTPPPHFAARRIHPNSFSAKTDAFSRAAPRARALKKSVPAGLPY